MTFPCRRPGLSDYAEYYAADLAQGVINENASKKSKKGGSSGFLNCLVSLGTFLLLEAFKSSINQQLCTPLKPIAASKLPNYSYSAQDAELVGEEKPSGAGI